MISPLGAPVQFSSASSFTHNELLVYLELIRYIIINIYTFIAIGPKNQLKNQLSLIQQLLSFSRMSCRRSTREMTLNGRKAANSLRGHEPVVTATVLIPALLPA